VHSLEPYPKGEIHLSISFVLLVLSSHRSGRNVSESIPKVPWSRFVSQGLAVTSVSLWNPGVVEAQAAFANIAWKDYRGGWKHAQRLFDTSCKVGHVIGCIEKAMAVPLLAQS